MSFRGRVGAVFEGRIGAGFFGVCMCGCGVFFFWGGGVEYCFH